MIIAGLHEGNNETRVSLSPGSVKQLIKSGFVVCLEHNAGLRSGFEDEVYSNAGALLQTDRKKLLSKAAVLLCVNEPTPTEINGLTSGSVLVGHIDDNIESPLLQWCLKNAITVFSMNTIPRISRAQSMDSLSSQANLAGYRAVIEGVAHYHRAVPMMMTAAGMIQPAKILILGAGVAGLQAIATAKRLGAVVYAFDVRAAAKEQVESLGAEFIEVTDIPIADSTSGYAGEMSEDYKRMQAELIDKYACMANIVICTALIPGKPAPILINESTVNKMKNSSVIVDMASSRGGNCEVSQCDKIIKHNQITVIGYSNLARFVPATASELYANNLLQVIHLLIPSPSSHSTFNQEDVIVQQGILCHEGKYRPFSPIKEQHHA